LLPDEGIEDRIRRIQQGIAGHYEAVGQRAAEIVAIEKGWAGIMATGHLFAKGASASEEQNNIYVGNLENIAADQFPAVFDYIALGHIHRAQMVGKQPRIRYSGSLIPLSFSEIQDKKAVLIAEFEGGLQSVRAVEVPVFRRLLTLRGTMDYITTQLQTAIAPDDPLKAWLEVVVEGPVDAGGLDNLLRSLLDGQNAEILRIRREHTQRALSETAPVEDLAALSSEEVFLQRCESKGVPESAIPELQQTFLELKIWATEHLDAM
jgi:DNA repair protein SbcD/Mre11